MMATWRTLLMVTLMLLISPVSWGGLIKTLLQDNLAGKPENFQEVSWKFDPDLAGRRSVEFQEKYGVRGEKLIARLGQGEDGYAEQRRLEQIRRDQEYANLT